MNPEDREKMLETMRNNAIDHRKHQTAILEKDLPKESAISGNFNALQNLAKEAYVKDGNIATLGENIERGKYFIDQKVLKDDADTFK